MLDVHKGKEVSLVVNAEFLNPRYLGLEIQDGPKAPFGMGNKQVEVAPLERFCHGNWRNAHCFRRLTKAAWRSVNLCSDTGRLEEMNLGSRWKQNCSLQPLETTSTPKHLRCWLSEKANKMFPPSDWGFGFGGNEKLFLTSEK